MSTEDEVDTDNEINFQDDNLNGNLAPEYETESQSIRVAGSTGTSRTTGDVDGVENNLDEEGEVLDVGEGGQGEGIVKSMVRNSEDLDAEIAVSLSHSQILMPLDDVADLAVVAKPSTDDIDDIDDSVSYSMSIGKIKLTYEQNKQAEEQNHAGSELGLLQSTEIETEEIQNAGRST